MPIYIQRAKTIVSDSPELVDFAVGVVNFNQITEISHVVV